MRLQSEFEITCECGAQFATHEREVVCKTCGRQIVVRWTPTPINTMDMPIPAGHLFVEDVDIDGTVGRIVTLRIAKGTSDEDAKLVLEVWERSVVKGVENEKDEVKQK